MKEIPSEGTKPFRKSEHLNRWQIEKRLKEERKEETNSRIEDLEREEKSIQQVANWNKANPEVPVKSVVELTHLLLWGIKP